MRNPVRSLVVAILVSALWQVVWPATGEAQVPQGGTTLARALDRAVVRVRTRSDLKNYRGAGFNRDSFDVEAFKGLGKAEDSTIVGWFTGFADFIGGIDSTACGEMTANDPTGALLATIPSSMDSVQVERWVRHWETAVAASFLAVERPPANEAEMMEAMFALIAKLPDTEISVSSKPSDKPKKPNPQRECRMMRGFFAEALVMEEPTRMTLLRGLADMMDEKKPGSSDVKQ